MALLLRRAGCLQQLSSTPIRQAAVHQRSSLAFTRAQRACRIKHVRDVQTRSYGSDAGPGSFWADKDKNASQQLSELKRAAEDYMNQILAQLKSEAASRGGNGAGAGRGSSSSSSSREDPQVQQLKGKIKNAIMAMQEGLVERDVEVRLLMLAALSREHILFIGPPGTAKSEIGRRLSKLLEGTYFERLLTRFSVPEELFGPLSMRALEEDQYVRQTRGYLPEAQVAFIDEIFKANSAILNTLLTILNERLFDNGSIRVPVPLVTLVGASNELPESEELDALYDRFLVRKAVTQVTTAGLTSMLDYYAGNSFDEEDMHTDRAAARDERGIYVDPSMMLDVDDFAATRRAAINGVRVPQHVIQLLADLRGYLQEKVEPPVYVSDRRLVKAVALMQVAAYCNGRNSVTEYDCLLLEHILWQRPEHAPKIHDWILNQLAVDDGMKQVQYLLSGIFSRTCKALGTGAEPIVEIQGEVQQLRGLLVERLATIMNNLEGGFPSVLDNLWLGQEEANAVATALVPKLQKAKTAVETMLYDVAALEVALEANCDAVSLANLMPKYWAAFIRNSPMEEVRPLGTTPMRI